MPEFLAERICCQINSNGDERIDHDEFIAFFLKATIGSKNQKLMIAYNCYDSGGDQSISKNELRLLLKHVPIYQQDANYYNKYGISFGYNEANITKNNLFEDKKRDDKEIEELIDILFEFNDDEIYFDEFETIC